MNDTILTPRQRYISNIINQSGGILREKIAEKIFPTYSVSKPTLIRDLNLLIKLKLIRSEGKAKATMYYPISHNPLLRVFDIENYFSYDPDQRVGAKKTFDSKIFEYLTDPQLADILMPLKNATVSFSDKTKGISPDLIRRELERFTIELSWKSSKIEGNTYTLLETESLIKEQKEASGKSKAETLMILNHKYAFDTILAKKRNFKTISISVINQLHNTLVKGLEISTGIRRHEVGITGTIYRPLGNEHQLKEALEKTVEMVNKVTDPYLKAFIASVMFPYVQPYSDGNKRTARMLCNAILLANDLLPLSYRNVDIDQFKKATILFYEQLSAVAFSKIFIEQVKFSNDNYFLK